MLSCLVTVELPVSDPKYPSSLKKLLVIFGKEEREFPSTINDNKNRSKICYQAQCKILQKKNLESLTKLCWKG